MGLYQSTILTLAKKFLFSKTSDGFLSFISGVSVVGVTLGVLSLTVVTSVINGFEGELSRVITGLNGDILLYSRAETIKDPRLIEKEIAEVVPEVRAITASFVTELMMSGAGNVAGVVLQGINHKTIGEVTEIPKRLERGHLPSGMNEVALGSALAEKLGVDVGSEVRLIAPFAGTAHTPPKALRGTVVGIVRMGMYEYDSKFAFMELGAVQAFLQAPGEITNFYIKLKPGADLNEATTRLSLNFGYPFRVKDWSQLNKNLFYAIKLEKAVIAIILTVIILVAAFNVVSTLVMMIHDKTKEVAILKAMGFRPSQCFSLFCFIGLGIGTVGTVIGLTLGLGLSWCLAKTHWIRLPADIYYIGFLPVNVRWSEVGQIGLVAVLISFLATLYPSWKVSRRSPLEGLRYE